MKQRKILILTHSAISHAGITARKEQVVALCIAVVYLLSCQPQQGLASDADARLPSKQVFPRWATFSKVVG